MFIDESRRDWVFSGHSAVSIPDANHQRVVSALYEGDVNAAGRRGYLATFVFVPSREARGAFKVALRGEPGTMLRDPLRRPIAISRWATATIRVDGSG